MSRLSMVFAAFFVMLASGCAETHRARLRDGAGLAEGSPVHVSSVRVGEVKTVRVVEGEVEVELKFDRGHEITLRRDACAIAARTESGPVLIVVPGTREPLEAGHAIPQCEPAMGDLGDLFRGLGEGMSELLRQLGQGLSNPNQARTPPSGP